MEEHVVDLIINKMCCVGLVIGEFPIILFNLGLDGIEEHGRNKIEEKLMNVFLDSKENLEIFSKGVDEIAKTSSSYLVILLLWIFVIRNLYRNRDFKCFYL